MFRRSVAASNHPLSPRRTPAPHRSRLRSWWLRLFAALLLCVISWQLWKVLMTGHRLHPWFFNQAGQETVHWSWLGPKCPLEYKRHQWSDIQAHKKRPYLLGGQQEPECTNCATDALWSNFCQFRSHVSYHCSYVVVVSTPGCTWSSCLLRHIKVVPVPNIHLLISLLLAW